MRQSGFLPPLPRIPVIQARLNALFPSSFPDRAILVGLTAARVVFVALYGGFVEGLERYMRPSFVYLFTEEQSLLTSDAARREWLAKVTKPGFRTLGERWYADTSREVIRDDLMRKQFHRLGVMQKLPGKAINASTPIHYLAADFAALFDPNLTGDALHEAFERWRSQHLDEATLQRMALRADGIHARAGDVFIDMPDGARIRLSAGASSDIAKALIEGFAARHLESPAVLWISASDRKTYPEFERISASVGLKFDIKGDLPDLILADLGEPIRFYFCEIVATDGPITEARKEAFLRIVLQSRIPVKNAAFLTAFEDRSSAAFRKCFSQIALGSLVWFRTEPALLVTLSELKSNNARNHR